MNGNGVVLFRRHTVLWWALFMVVMMGCSTHPSWQKHAPGLAIDQPQRERALRDREAELSGLRADVASARIAAAKKEAEVQALQEQLLRLRQELGVAYQQLAEERAEAGKAGRKSVVPSQATGTLNAGQVAMPSHSHMDTVLRKLTAEVEGLKRQLQAVQAAHKTVDERQAQETRGIIGTAPSPLAGQTPVHSLAIGFASVATQLITVEAGDSLTELAQRYHTSETEIQQMNVLEGESLRPGQVLLVPVSPGEGP